MAKKPTISTVASGYQGTATINNNFQNIRDQFDNTLSRDGSTPNAMLADLDMNGYSILNVGANNGSGFLTVAAADARYVNQTGDTMTGNLTTPALYTNGLYINGNPVVPSTLTYNGIVKETIIATSGQTVFNLSSISYTPGINNLAVYVDGVYQRPANYTENSATQVTFSVGLHVGAIVDFVVLTINSLGGTADAVNLTYTSPGSGAVTRTVYSKFSETVSVKDFGAVGDGITNDTTAFNNAIATGARVYVPEGTYLCNAIINTKTIIFGDGSLASIVKPFNPAIAVFTYTIVAQQNPIYRFWDYHSEVRDLGFFSTANTGVGFTFARTNPSDYQNTDEFANNVKFYGCYFEGFAKAIQFPFGNIGTEIYSCGFASNKYGIYTISNKFGAGMHAGNKYVFGGEFHGNECAVYFNNTTDGFGSIVFNGTIFEYNLIALYGFNSSTVVTPISFNDCWFEGNGVGSTGAATVNIDSWTGSSVSTQTLNKRTFIFDGNNCTYYFKSSFFNDAYLKGQVQNVFVNNCRIETETGFGGGPLTVDNPSNSGIYITNSFSDSARIQANGVTVNGPLLQSNYLVGTDQNGSAARAYITNPRASKVTNYGSSKIFSAPLNTAATLTGSANVVGNVIGDGVLYNQCNEFTKNSFLSSEILYLTTPNSIITTSAGWYVVTFDFKVTTGNPSVNISDGSSAFYITNLRVPTTNTWYSYAAIGYFDSAKTLGLSFIGNNANCVWQVSAYQMHRFSSRQQAVNFLQSNSFAES